MNGSLVMIRNGMGYHKVFEASGALNALPDTADALSTRKTSALTFLRRHWPMAATVETSGIESLDAFVAYQMTMLDSRPIYQQILAAETNAPWMTRRDAIDATELERHASVCVFDILGVLVSVMKAAGRTGRSQSDGDHETVTLASPGGSLPRCHRTEATP